MYLYPINYYSKIASNNLIQKDSNVKFKGNNKNLTKLVGLSLSPILPLGMMRDGYFRIDKYDNDNNINPKLNKLSQESIAPPEHHPDFYELYKNYAILASSYFRRGGCYGSPCNEFVDVINALKQYFNNASISKESDKKVKMLIGGIGESQEPFSLLATVKSFIGEREVSDVLDMYTVDLQGKPNKYTLFKQSFYDQLGEPEFVQSGFVYDEGEKYGLSAYKTYRVTDEIFEYLSNVYSNPEKAKWKTRIQEALKEYPEEEFDVVSINNTLIYINNPVELRESVKNIYRMLKQGGIFISDKRLKIYDEIFTPENSTEIYPGIYKKK